MSLVPALAVAETLPYEGVKLTILERDTAVLPFDINSMSANLIREKTGIDIEFMLVADTDWGTKVSTLMAANNLPDITYTDFPLINQYAPDGMFASVQEYLDAGKLPNYSAAIEKAKETIANYKVDGDLYSFQLIWSIGLPNGAVPYIRGDILKELGLEAPKSFDELYEVLKAFKARDPENEPWVTRWAMLQIDYSYGTGGFYYDPAVGRYVCGYLDAERYPSYLEYCHKLYAEGLVDPDFLTTTSADWQEACKNGSCTFTFNNCVFVNQFNMALQQDQPDAYWEPLYTLENPWGEKRGAWSVGVGEWQATQPGWVVSADCKNIDAAMYLMDFMYSDLGFEITNWGQEGTTFTKNDQGEYEMMPEFVKKVQSGEVTMQSYLSGADLGFCCVVDDWANRATALSPEGIELYNFWLSDDAMDTKIPDPPLTADETEKIANLKSKFDVILSDQNAFIIGTRDISEWPTVAQALTDAGAQEYLDIYNGALARLKGEN